MQTEVQSISAVICWSPGKSTSPRFAASMQRRIEIIIPNTIDYYKNLQDREQKKIDRL